MTKSLTIAIFLQNKYNGTLLGCLAKIKYVSNKEKGPKTIRL